MEKTKKGSSAVYSFVYAALLLYTLAAMGSFMGISAAMTILFKVFGVFLIIAGVLSYLFEHYGKQKSLDTFFEGAGLKNKREEYIKVDRGKSGENFYILRIPPGLSTADLEAKKQAIEEFLNKEVEIKYKDGIAMIIAKKS